MSTFARRRMGNLANSRKESCRFHRDRDVLATFLPECRCRALVVPALGEGEPELVFDDPRDFLAASMIVGEADNGPVVANERPNHVRMFSARLRVEDAASRSILKPKLSFVVTNKAFDNRFRIRHSRRRIDVDMVHWSRRSTTRSNRDQLADLTLQIVGRKVARPHDLDDLTFLHLEQMTGKGRSAGSSGRAGDHSAAFTARRRSMTPTRSADDVRNPRMINSVA